MDCSVFDMGSNRANKIRILYISMGIFMRKEDLCMSELRMRRVHIPWFLFFCYFFGGGIGGIVLVSR